MIIDRCPELLSCQTDIFTTSENGVFITVCFSEIRGSDGKQVKQKPFAKSFSSLGLNSSNLYFEGVTDACDPYSLCKNLISSGGKAAGCNAHIVHF